MHIRTFKAQAVKLWLKANPGWEIGETEFGPKRGLRPHPFRGHLPDHERETLHWRVRVRRGNRSHVVAFNWGYHSGLWSKGPFQ